jgi:hypothetical protein
VTVAVDQDYRELRALSECYAIAVDDGDGDAFAAAFLPDATLQMFRPADGSSPSTDMTGTAALAGVPTSVQSRYESTLHFLGQSVYDIDGDQATGTTYCLAHHFSPGPDGGLDYVMHIRYSDTCARDSEGRWRIMRRIGRCYWTETRAVDLVPARQ